MSLLQLIDVIFLNQYILESTRGNNILGLALCNNEQLIHHYLWTPTVFSNHNILEITLKYSPKQITTNYFEENKNPLSKFNNSNSEWVWQTEPSAKWNKLEYCSGRRMYK